MYLHIFISNMCYAAKCIMQVTVMYANILKWLATSAQVLRHIVYASYMITISTNR